MTIGIGIGLAFVAMLCWGFGDFLIQKTTRKLGDWETLFIITAFGAIILLPFVWKSLPGIFLSIVGSGGNYGGSTLWILAITCIVLLLAALFEFESLKKGKLAVVEPIWSFEVPAAAFLAFFLLNERITLTQLVIIITLVICLFLVGFKEKHLRKSFLFEKGVFVAFLGAIFMGAANFFMGWGGRVTDPLIINFVTDFFIMVVTGLYLVGTGRFGHLWKDIRNDYSVLLPMSISDKVAWIAYVFAMTLAPIAVATALSESYIIIAVLLGLFINHEKIKYHQKVGLVGAIITAVILAVITT